MCVARTKPIEYPEYPKHIGEHLWQMADGMYAFTDETGWFSDKYATREAAEEALNRYGDWLNQENEA